MLHLPLISDKTPCGPAAAVPAAVPTAASKVNRRGLHRVNFWVTKVVNAVLDISCLPSKADKSLFRKVSLKLQNKP